MKLLPLILAVTVFLLYLLCERIALNRHRNAIPLRISVTGTRGKSSVVRMIASVLREDGWKVIAKTTGSQARLVLPDAQEVEVTRRGVTSIIEQKQLLKTAAKTNADCLVAEIMSLHPENHYVESQQMLQPHIVVITNVREDHTEAMGKTKEAIAAVLSLDIPAKAKVFVPEKENRSLFETAVKEAAGELIVVPDEAAISLLRQAPDLRRKEFRSNLDLVYGLGQHLHIDPNVILNGIRRARHDIGRFTIWKYHPPDAKKTFYLVNGFAANDPESTWQLLAKVKEVLPPSGGQLIGLLNLRADRGDRTKQWLEFLSNGTAGLSGIYVTGAHSQIVKRKLPSVRILKNTSPEAIMKTMLAEIEDQSVIFGCGNIKGAGELLVDYWNKIGAVYEL